MLATEQGDGELLETRVLEGAEEGRRCASDASAFDTQRAEGFVIGYHVGLLLAAVLNARARQSVVCNSARQCGAGSSARR